MNRFQHTPVPTPVEEQPVIRMNRDTLYSSAIVDLAKGAELTVPDAGGRYLSVMVVNEDHYINRVFHGAGKYSASTWTRYDTRYACRAPLRVLADPHDPDRRRRRERRASTAWRCRPVSAEPLMMPDYDEESASPAVRNARPGPRRTTCPRTSVRVRPQATRSIPCRHLHRNGGRLGRTARAAKPFYIGVSSRACR